MTGAEKEVLDETAVRGHVSPVVFDVGTDLV